MKLQFKMGSCMVRILKISTQFCRISEFGSIKIREFATRIVAQRQEVTRRNGVRTLFFSAVGITNSRLLFSAKLQIRQNGDICENVEFTDGILNIRCMDGSCLEHQLMNHKNI
jgi:hypothetical protein